MALNSASFLFLFLLVQPGFQDFHCPVAVLELGPLVLTLNDDAARQMGDPDRRLDFVHILAARAARPKRIDPQILLLDRHINVIVKLGIDKHGGK